MIYCVEDDDNIRELVIYTLETTGLKAKGFAEGTAFMEALAFDTPELILLDIMLPGEDGLELLKKLKNSAKTKDIPVIMVTAKGAEYDKVIGLDSGADDYVTKPFEAMELIARVNSHIRRYEQILDLKKNAGKPVEQSHRLIVGGLELDQYSKEAFVNGNAIRLTAKEFQILELLMSYPGRVYSAEEIYEAVWKEDAINTETIMVHVRKLREKIEVNPRKPEYLKVVWGIGYKIEKVR